MLVLKAFGMIDIITAVALYFNINMLFLALPLFLVHVLKGIASMGGDFVGKVYGIVDIISAFAMLFVFDLPITIDLLLVAVLVFKGVSSLV